MTERVIAKNTPRVREKCIKQCKNSIKNAVKKEHISVFLFLFQPLGQFFKRGVQHLDDAQYVVE